MQEPFTISVGKHARDTNWKPWSGTLDEFCDTFFAGFRYGQKDGPCIVPGHLVGGDRGSNLTLRNSLVMLDHDNGITLDAVEAQIREAGLRAILWTTHSHLKTTTDLGQGGVVAHRKKKRFDETVPDVEVVRDFLKERKEWTPEMLASIERVEDVLDPKKGMQVRVLHGRMPKVRSLFFLEKPFAFTEPGMVQKDRVAEWKDRIKGMAYTLKLPFDSACQDPAHLMYLPACKDADNEKAAGHEIRFVDGSDATLQFDFVRYTECADSKDIRAARAVENRARTFATLGLGTFIRRGGPAESFRAAEWFRDVSGQEPRRIADEIKFHFECPNDAEHSNAGDPKDTAFFVQDASPVEQRTWMLHCRHDSCISKFAGDRARLLDYACEAFGITDANDLLPYTDAELLGDGDADDYDALGDVDALIAELTPETPAVGVNAVIGYLARFPADPVTQERRKKLVGEKTKLGIRAINAAVKGAKPAGPVLPQEHENIPGAEQFFDEAPPPPVTDEEFEGTRQIWKEWAWSDQMRVLIELIQRRNEEKKHVFLQPDGHIVRVVSTPAGVAFAEIEAAPQWAMVCRELGIEFRTTAKPEAQAPFKDLMVHLTGGVAWVFPIVERAVEIPVFGEDGSLRTEKGYHEGARVYLDPRMEFLPVPEEITEEHVEEALDIIGTAIADFPFSDVFDGTDPLPVRTYEEGEDDKRPNFARGRASRANMHAMLLQPFARALMGNNATPLYHIDKSERGTGANYLANVLGFMLYGTTLPPQTVSEREEELDKVVTSSLYAGHPTIFFDNLNHTLSSAALASALTSGVWTGRILGTKDVPRIPVKVVWILAANNGHISEELRRRVVPIRLDAALPNPAADRPVSYYVIPNLLEYLQEHRAALIWAAHVLIRNYLQTPAAARKAAIDDFPYTPLQSFQKWSDVMGGILACAGISGFLENREPYVDSNEDDDKSGLSAYFSDVFARTKGEWIDAEGLLEVLQSGPIGHIASDKPLAIYGINLRCDLSDEQQKKHRLGIVVSRNRGRVFDTVHGFLQVEKKHNNKGTLYRMVIVGSKKSHDNI